MEFLKNKWVIAILVAVVALVIESKTKFFSNMWSKVKTTTAPTP